MNSEQTKDLINGIGAMAEMVALFYKGLISNGIPTKDAAGFTIEFVKQITPHI